MVQRLVSTVGRPTRKSCYRLSIPLSFPLSVCYRHESPHPFFRTLNVTDMSVAASSTRPGISGCVLPSPLGDDLRSPGSSECVVSMPSPDDVDGFVSPCFFLTSER